MQSTSLSAHQAIQPHKHTQRERVRRCIKRSMPAGIIDEDVQALLKMRPATQLPRRLELVEMGRVADSGRRALTKAGRQAIVWVTANNPPRPPKPKRPPRKTLRRVARMMDTMRVKHWKTEWEEVTKWLYAISRKK